jgi:hypothetical protein
VKNHYGCVQNVVRKKFLGQRSGQRRRVETLGDGREGRLFSGNSDVTNGRRGNDGNNDGRYSRDEKREKGQLGLKPGREGRLFSCNSDVTNGRRGNDGNNDGRYSRDEKRKKG